MLTKQEFYTRLEKGPMFLDGATGSNLRKAGMPKDCCAELWILEHPDVLQNLQRQYVQAGSQIIYAPTFQAQPLALAKEGKAEQTEHINAQLVAISRQAAPDALIAGDLTTMAAFIESYDPSLFDDMVENYRRQIRGLIDGGADLLVAETLMYRQEAEAILTAAELEEAGACLYSFTMQPDASLFSGAEAGPILKDLEEAGAAAVGFNCVAADMMTPYLVSKLRRYVKGPILCKPNAGNPVINVQGIAEYSMGPMEFSFILSDCSNMGASLLGGCCGTDPQYIRQAVTQIMNKF